MAVVVVGYDGSRGAEAALARGIARAGDEGRLYVVHAWHAPRSMMGSTAYGVLVAWSLERAELEMAELGRRHPALEAVTWEATVLQGAAAEAIAEFALGVDADEIIVGTRGAGRAGVLLGSVAHGLVHVAACPVTVIPDRAAGTGHDTSPPADALPAQPAGPAQLRSGEREAPSTNMRSTS
jgi:nucleotide-binding universal stress UspA family protein